MPYVRTTETEKVLGTSSHTQFLPNKDGWYGSCTGTRTCNCIAAFGWFNSAKKEMPPLFYMCYFIVVLLHEKQSKKRYHRVSATEFENPEFNRNTSTIYFQFKIRARISICLITAHWRISLPALFCLWIAKLAFPWNLHCLKSHPLGTSLPLTSNLCLDSLPYWIISLSFQEDSVLNFLL